MRTLITTVAVVASLALAGTGAMAANANLHKAAKAHVAHTHVAGRVAAPRYYARGPSYFDPGRFIQSMLGGAWPAVNARLAHSGRRTGTYSYDSPSYSPSYDSPPIDNSSMANDAAAAANSAMLQSMQAAQQQNDEANAAFNAGMAAALQTEINANN
jgi:hypothetical protein